MLYKELEMGKRKFLLENSTSHVLPESYGPWRGVYAITERDFLGTLGEELKKGNIDKLVTEDGFKKFKDKWGKSYKLRITDEPMNPAVILKG